MVLSHQERRGAGRGSVPVSARCKRSPSLTIPTNRSSEFTTGTPLIPRSERSLAKSCTDVSGPTVITFAIITSIARVSKPPCRFAENRRSRVRCVDLNQSRTMNLVVDRQAPSTWRPLPRLRRHMMAIPPAIRELSAEYLIGIAPLASARSGLWIRGPFAGLDHPRHSCRPARTSQGSDGRAQCELLARKQWIRSMCPICPCSLHYLLSERPGPSTHHICT